MYTSFYSMYGGILFLGIFLGLLFLMGAAMIIYYKQISEGYEDKERFEIMQKVGMSHKEVKSSYPQTDPSGIFPASWNGCPAYCNGISYGKKTACAVQYDKQRAFCRM